MFCFSGKLDPRNLGASTTKLGEKVLAQGKNVQIIRRLVKNRNILSAYQHPQQVEAPLLASRQSRDQAVLLPIPGF